MDNDKKTKKDEEIKAMVQNPINWMSEREKKEWRESELTVDKWVEEEFGLSLEEWIEKRNVHNFFKNLMPSSSDIVNSNKLIKKSDKLPKKPKKEENKKPKKRIKLARIHHFCLIADKTEIKIIFLSRSLREEESNEHRSLFCKNFDKCFWFAEENEAISFSCIECPQKGKKSSREGHFLESFNYCM